MNGVAYSLAEGLGVGVVEAAPGRGCHDDSVLGTEDGAQEGADLGEILAVEFDIAEQDHATAAINIHQKVGNDPFVIIALVT